MKPPKIGNRLFPISPKERSNIDSSAAKIIVDVI